MKAGRNRLGRKDHSARAHADRERALRRTLRLSLALVPLSLALAPLAADAQTGGAGVPAAGRAHGKGLVFSSPMRSAGATWYGPGLYGNGTACGRTLRPRTLGVAHRTLPCGTVVKFVYHGRSLVTRVIDRGPYSAGNDFDLTNGARLALRFPGVDRLRYAVALRKTKPKRRRRHRD